MSKVGPSVPHSTSETASIHTSTPVTVSSSKRPFVIVESLYIAGFEPRTKTDPTHQQRDSTYYVYEIVLENEAVGRWTVWRRYNDFSQLYQDIQKWAELRIKLEGVKLRLPSKFTLFSGDQRELVATRAEQLQNSFLMPMFSAVGGVDLDFWHHPVIMTFFEVPVIRKDVLVNNTPGQDGIPNELNALYGDANSWMEEFRQAEELVERVGRLVERHRKTRAKQLGASSQSFDTTPAALKTRTRIVATNTERVVESATAKLDSLEKALDSGTSTGTEPEIHKRALSKLRRTLVAAINQLPATHPTTVPSQQTKLVENKEGSKEKSALAKQEPLSPSPAPNKRDSLVQHEGPKNTETQTKSTTTSLSLKNQRKQIEVITQQRTAIQTQDQQLSQISLALRRQKLLAGEITNEVEKESSQIDALARQLDQTKSKLDRNVEKVKRV